MNILLELTREVNKTLIMATHNPELVALADQVYRVKNGVLVAEQPGKSQSMPVKRP
jgi:putative ABC transport system ATP-binding protein